MLGRWGESSDLIGACIFLSSDASAYITGSDILVDGGLINKGFG
jgi:NAD(P)-dependent dehydrogenase (short-subunit alcohol dehydrogenase family)